MRCYDGCPDSDLQRVIDGRRELLNKIRSHKPQAHVTFHAPHAASRGGWVVHVWGRELSGYHQTMEGALIEAQDHA